MVLAKESRVRGEADGDVAGQLGARVGIQLRGADGHESALT